MQRFFADPARPQRLLRGFLQGRAIPVHDHLPALREAGEGSGLYYPVIAHWNARGHRVAARALAEFLVRERLIPRASPNGSPPPGS